MVLRGNDSHEITGQKRFIPIRHIHDLKFNLKNLQYTSYLVRNRHNISNEYFPKLIVERSLICFLKQAFAQSDFMIQ